MSAVWCTVVSNKMDGGLFTWSQNAKNNWKTSSGTCFLCNSRINYLFSMVFTSSQITHLKGPFPLVPTRLGLFSISIEYHVNVGGVRKSRDVTPSHFGSLRLAPTGFFRQTPNTETFTPLRITEIIKSHTRCCWVFIKRLIQWRHSLANPRPAVCRCHIFGSTQLARNPDWTGSENVPGTRCYYLMGNPKNWVESRY